MAIVEITLKQRYLGKDTYNVFHYVEGTPGALTVAYLNDIGNVFKANLVPALNAIQVNGVANTELRIIQYGNPNVNTVVDLDNGGTLTDNPQFYLPAAQTYAFKLGVGQSLLEASGLPYVGTRYITNGYKRFTGVSDGLIATGDWLETFAESTDVDTLEEQLFASLVPTGVGLNTAQPVVVGRPIEANEDLPARAAIFANIQTAQLQPPRWTRRRQ